MSPALLKYAQSYLFYANLLDVMWNRSTAYYISLLWSAFIWQRMAKMPTNSIEFPAVVFQWETKRSERKQFERNIATKALLAHIFQIYYIFRINEMITFEHKMTTTDKKKSYSKENSQPKRIWSLLVSTLFPISLAIENPLNIRMTLDTSWLITNNKMYIFIIALTRLHGIVGRWTMFAHEMCHS